MTAYGSSTMAASNNSGPRTDQQSFMDISSRLGSLEASVSHGQASREMLREEIKSLRQAQETHFSRIETALHDNQSSNERLINALSQSVTDLNKRMEKVEAIARDYQKTKTRGYGIAAGLGLGAGGASGFGFDKIMEFIRRFFGG